MVGASFACALARLPLRVAVVEAFPFNHSVQPSFDERTTALSRGSQRILSTLGIWEQVAGEAQAIRRIHVSEKSRFGSAVITAREQGLDALGYVVANRVLGAALWDLMQASPRIELYSPAQAVEVSQNSQSIEVTLTGNGAQRLSGRLLVIAEGARSGLRDALGIDATHKSYDQAAIVGTVEVSMPGDGSAAYERFTADGPLALLPVGASRYAFVLARSAEQTESLLALDDRAFRDLLQQTAGFRLGRFGRLGKRAAYPLALTQADQVHTDRAVVIGNAAHGLHPVAGQGYNLGLRDAATLAEVLADGVHASSFDAGAHKLLENFAAWRSSDHRNVVAFTDGLVRLFDLPGTVTGMLRGAALSAFDVVPGAKSELARHTMGLAGRLTRLARGLPL